MNALIKTSFALVLSSTLFATPVAFAQADTESVAGNDYLTLVRFLKEDSTIAMTIDCYRFGGGPRGGEFASDIGLAGGWSEIYARGPWTHWTVEEANFGDEEHTLDGFTLVTSLLIGKGESLTNGYTYEFVGLLGCQEGQVAPKEGDVYAP